MYVRPIIQKSPILTTQLHCLRSPHICTKLANIDLFSLIMLLIQKGTVLFILIFSMLTMRMSVLASFSTITRTVADTREASSSAAASASCAGLEGLCATLTAHHIENLWRRNRRWINGWHRYSILHLPATCTYVDSRRVRFVRSFPQLALTMHTQEMDERITVSWMQVLQRWCLFTLSEYSIIEPCLKWGCIEFK